ncbi:MAG: proline dehydrogenase family protein, partial [Nitrososphaerota archaeon]
NKLGEHLTSKTQIENTVKQYIMIVSSLKKSGIEGGISVKPTQLGLSRSRNECLQNYNIIIEKAALSQAFVWIDMESSEHTDDTIGIYLDLFYKYERLGLALQANLRRSKKDLMRLLEKGAKIRLVKGAYRENKEIAFQSRKQVDQNYRALMEILFLKGNEFGIATHDYNMIEQAIKLSKKYEKKFEFQMLKGIRDELKPDLLQKGFSIAEYIPYGTNWLPYSIRRLKERKRNILLLGSSFLHSHRV